MRDFTPVVALWLAQATREKGRGVLVTNTHISRIRCHWVVWGVRGLLLLQGLLPDKVLLEAGLTLRTSPISAPLRVIQRHGLLQVLILEDRLERVVVNNTVAGGAMLRVLLHELLVHDAALLSAKIVICNDAPNDVMLIEGTHPTLRDLILYLVFHLELIRTLGECCLDGLLMQFVEFVIETGYHILDFC